MLDDLGYYHENAIEHIGTEGRVLGVRVVRKEVDVTNEEHEQKRQCYRQIVPIH